MSKNKLTIAFHTTKEFPTLCSSTQEVATLKDLEFPEKTPILVKIYQKTAFLDADLHHHEMTFPITYIVGKCEAAANVLTDYDTYRLQNPREFFSSCPDGEMIVYTSPSGKNYVAPKTSDTKEVESSADLIDHVIDFVGTYFNSSEKDIASVKEQPKIKQKIR